MAPRQWLERLDSFNMQVSGLLRCAAVHKDLLVLNLTAGKTLFRGEVMRDLLEVE